MINKLTLPRTFKDNSKDGKYKKLEGLPKISYSQLGSWKSLQYRQGYIKQYFAGISLPSGCFTQCGTDFGTMVEWIGNGRVGEKPQAQVLTQQNVEEVAELVEYLPNSLYEDYIVVDCGDFVIEGYADKIAYDGQNIRVYDFKTGNIDKPEKYETKDYMQTRLYAYQKELEGYNVVDCAVRMYNRKGNGFPKSPLRLTGECLHIDTPYDKEETRLWIENDVRKTVKEISDLYTQYLKLFG